jgi:hypothetical protein
MAILEYGGMRFHVRNSWMRSCFQTCRLGVEEAAGVTPCELHSDPEIAPDVNRGFQFGTGDHALFRIVAEEPVHQEIACCMIGDSELVTMYIGVLVRYAASEFGFRVVRQLHNRAQEAMLTSMLKVSTASAKSDRNYWLPRCHEHG